MNTRYVKALAVTGFSIALVGCASTTIEGDGMLTPDSRAGKHTLHGSYYDFNWKEPPADKCENQQGLYRVTAYTNPLYAFVSLFSLGLYVPLTMEWWCDSTPAAFDEGPAYDPSE